MRLSSCCWAAVIWAASLLPAGVAGAQDVSPLPQKTWDVSIGVGAAFVPDYEGSNDYEVRPLPEVALSYRDIVFLRGTSVGANAVTITGTKPGDKLQVGPLARYRFGRDQDDNDALHGLGDVDSSVEVGGFARYTHGGLGLDLTAVQDVADGHEGALVEAGLGYRMPVAAKWQASLRASTSWASDKYMESYFGVSPAQAARRGGDSYDAGAGFKDAGLSAGLEYAITSTLSIGGRVGYTRLLGDAADSPMVDKDGSADQVTTSISTRYRF